MNTPTTLQLAAKLLVDTGDTAPRPGLRAGDNSRRQLLFQAGDLYLDLSLHRRSGSPELSLIGQLLDAGTASRNLADLPVEVRSEDGSRTRTRSNGLGEFLMTGLADGVATLGITIDQRTNVQVPLPAAELAGGGGR